MQKVKIYLNRVEKVDNKIQNVVSYFVNSQKEVAARLSLHDGNVSKFELMNVKI